MGVQAGAADQMRSSSRVRKPDSAKKAALGELTAARQKKTAKHRCAYFRASNIFK